MNTHHRAHRAGGVLMTLCLLGTMALSAALAFSDPADAAVAGLRVGISARGSAGAGQAESFRIVAYNASSTARRDVRVRLKLSGGLDPATGSLAPTGTADTGGVYIWEIPSLPAYTDLYADFKVTLRHDAVAQQRVTAVGYLKGTTPQTTCTANASGEVTNDGDSCDYAVFTPSRPLMYASFAAKPAGATIISAGSRVTWRVTTYANDLHPIWGARMDLVTPAEMVPGTAAFSNPSQGTVSGTTWRIGDLALNRSASVDVSGVLRRDVIARAGESARHIYAHYTSLNAPFTPAACGTSQDDTCPDGYFFVGAAQMHFASFTGETPRSGQTATYSVVIENIGSNPGRANAVKLSLGLPPGIDPSSVRWLSHDSGTVSGTVWSVGDMEHFAVRRAKFTARAYPFDANHPAARNLVRARITAINQATVSTCAYQPSFDNDGCESSNNPAGPSHLRVATYAPDQNTEPGHTVTWQARITNDSTTDATGTRLAVTYPSNVIPLIGKTPLNVGTIKAHGSALVTITGTLSPYSSAPRAEVRTRVSTGDELTNPTTCLDEATVAEDTDKCDPAGLTVTPVSMQADTAWRFVNSRSKIRYVVRVRNTGQGPLSSVTVRNTFPRGYKTYDLTYSGAGFNRSTGVWRVGSLKVGETRTLVIYEKVRSALWRYRPRHTIIARALEVPYRLGQQVNGSLVRDTDRYDADYPHR